MSKIRGLNVVYALMRSVKFEAVLRGGIDTLLTLVNGIFLVDTISTTPKMRRGKEKKLSLMSG